YTTAKLSAKQFLKDVRYRLDKGGLAAAFPELVPIIVHNDPKLQKKLEEKKQSDLGFAALLKGK
ncbi:MAG: hypothetical protein WCG42_06330, partial [Parachlamydiaceae bacterium]